MLEQPHLGTVGSVGLLLDGALILWRSHVVEAKLQFPEAPSSSIETTWASEGGTVSSLQARSMDYHGTWGRWVPTGLLLRILKLS